MADDPKLDAEPDSSVSKDADADDDNFDASEPIGFEDSIDDFNTTSNEDDPSSRWSAANLGPANFLHDIDDVSFKMILMK